MIVEPALAISRTYQREGEFSSTKLSPQSRLFPSVYIPTDYTLEDANLRRRVVQFVIIGLADLQRTGFSTDIGMHGHVVRTGLGLSS